MVSKRGLILAVFVFLYVANSWADQCTDSCGTGSSCNALNCFTLSPALGGCWHDGSDCVSCSGAKGISSCEGYGVDSCAYNPCGLSGGCNWVLGACISAGSGNKDCRSGGCPDAYRCMADGECVHLSVSIQDYCNTAYKEHGFFYDPRDPESCDDMMKICTQLEKRCVGLPENTPLDRKRREGCKLVKNMCLECAGDCELRKGVFGVEDIIYGIVAGVAIVIMGMNGLRLMSSEDPLERRNAKRSIVYTILSIIVVLVAVKFVEYLWIIFL